MRRWNGKTSARASSITVTRGDVWLAALDPTVGSEIRKTRPFIVVSPPETHDCLRTVIVARRQPAIDLHLFAVQ